MQLITSKRFHFLCICVCINFFCPYLSEKNVYCLRLWIFLNFFYWVYYYYYFQYLRYCIEVFGTTNDETVKSWPKKWSKLWKIIVNTERKNPTMKKPMQLSLYVYHWTGVVLFSSSRVSFRRFKMFIFSLWVFYLGFLALLSFFSSFCIILRHRNAFYRPFFFRFLFIFAFFFCSLALTHSLLFLLTIS